MGGDHQTDDERQQWKKLGSNQQHFAKMVRFLRCRVDGGVSESISMFCGPIDSDFPNRDDHDAMFDLLSLDVAKRRAARAIRDARKQSDRQPN